MKIQAQELKDALRHLNQSVLLKDAWRGDPGSLLYGEKVKDGYVLMTGDYEFFTKVPISVTAPLNFACEFKGIENFLRFAKNDDVITIVKDDDRTRFAYRNHSAPFLQMNVSKAKRNKLMVDFKKNEKVLAVDIEVPIHKDIFQAIDHDNLRIELNGAFLDFENLKIVGTDSARLAFRDLPNFPEHKDVPSIIIHSEALVGLKDGETIRITKIGEEGIEFETSSGIVRRAHFISGRFPDYARIIPESFAGAIRINGIDLKDALLGKNDVQLSFADRKLTITDENSGVSSIVPCDYTASEPFTILTQGHFLYDAICENEIKIEVLTSNHNTFKIGNTLIMPIVEGKAQAFPKDFKNARFAYKKGVEV